ncbi:unnamed protein product [Prunus armeniaca]|uniref:Uncharacterized protein n=1 Tax=Prunus armeniaca TaxID=36596 RepID=A0A6J5U429_PRUAR|nr:unnamed protein product [Prunus armeniaca]
MRAYRPMVHPMTSEDLWPKCHRPPLMPPFYHKQPGRTRKKRKRSAGEQPPNLILQPPSCRGITWKLPNLLKLHMRLKQPKLLKLPHLLKLLKLLKLPKKERGSSLSQRGLNFLKRRMVLKLCKEVNLCKLVQVLKLANVLNLPNFSNYAWISTKCKLITPFCQWYKQKGVQISCQEEEIYQSEGFVGWLSTLEILMMCKCYMFC